MTANQNGHVPVELDNSVQQFAGRNGNYYARQFMRIQSSSGISVSFNFYAALLGPFWAASRSLWGFFWLSAMANLLALVQVGRGLWGELGADQLSRAARLSMKAQEMSIKAQVAIDSGASNAESLQRTTANLQQAAENATAAASLAAHGASQLLLLGALGLLIIMVAQGFLGNLAYEKKYCRWRINKLEKIGFSVKNLIFGVVLLILIFPLTIYRYTAENPLVYLIKFPSDKSFYSFVANWLDAAFDVIASKGSVFFGGITSGISALLDTLEVILVHTPWPVTMLVIVIMAWRLAGPRVAVFTVAALAYLAFMGFWEKSMSTIALLGTAATMCVLIGVPLGVWCAKNRYAQVITEPALDFMQTMPAFVYLIPIIAFFGTGKPPGIIATIIFGLPPVVRLTALGIRQVPPSIVEGALAFGCNSRKLLLDVEIPLAMPSIMAGVNQTILMCLSMVVIASLIGAEGLGSDVLMALQYAAKGQGLLAGVAILLCAMVIDRIVQGRFKRRNE
ncbi:proline/glycine betaine ABC transporter permease [Pseudomonas sp. MPC6]|uniref:ABC transporter permease n=1 Tax=unclassified Pseudomonas TaxID=196821 RepID=UPI001110C1C6|nr:proline/glycine betaine ABC transporter permease [Pseudomonas sp. MPC6]QCY09524.1 proline/glycine betaine ABC transporter permease [Pseudomonas sp. MPC6]